MDSALSVVQNLERDLQEVKAAARDGKLKPLPGETVGIIFFGGGGQALSGKHSTTKLLPALTVSILNIFLLKS